MLLGEIDVCEICFQEEAEDDDVLVFCDGCGMCVHALCYEIEEELHDDEKWFCEACATLLTDKMHKAHFEGSTAEFPFQNYASFPKCCLCGNGLPIAMQKIFRTQLFAHVLCFRFAPLLNYEFYHRINAGNTEAEALENIYKNLSEYPCDVCKLGGNVRDCCVRSCKCAFHPSCCVFNGGKLFIKETDTVEFLQLLCAEHSTKSSVDTKIWYGLSKILKNDLDFPIDFAQENIGLHILSVRTKESERTFQQSLRAFGGNALQEYDRYLTIEQQAVLQCQQVWQYVRVKSIKDPVAVGSGLALADVYKAQVVVLRIGNGEVELPVCYRMYTNQGNLDFERVDLAFQCPISQKQLEEFMIRGLFPVFLFKKPIYMPFRSMLLHAYDDQSYYDRSYVLTEATDLLSGLEEYIGLFCITFDAYSLDYRLYSYLR